VSGPRPRRATHFIQLANDSKKPRRRSGSLRPAATLLVTLAIAFPVAADPKFVETEELRIIYYDPDETYLVPHATQSFLSGLATHERLFD